MVLGWRAGSGKTSLTLPNGLVVDAGNAAGENVGLKVIRVQQVVLEKLARIVGLAEGRDRREAVGPSRQFDQPRFEQRRLAANISAPGKFLRIIAGSSPAH
jgi:hypothetical protein